jgi:hypothetical protein
VCVCVCVTVNCKLCILAITLEGRIITYYNRYIHIYIYYKLKYQQNIPDSNTEREQQKWITFTHTGNYIHKITKLVKDANLNVAFKTTFTLNNFLTNKQKTNIYEQSGIYKITFQSCYKVLRLSHK